MSRVHRRGVIAGPKGGGTTKTYAEFQAYVDSEATSGDRSWTTSLPSGDWRWTAAAATGTLSGSPWGPSSAEGFLSGLASRVARIVQHSLPSEAIFNEQVSSARVGFIRSVSSGSLPVSLPAVNRNGFTSSAASDAGGLATMLITRLDYFDPVLGPMTMNPSTGTGPTPLTW